MRFGPPALDDANFEFARLEGVCQGSLATLLPTAHGALSGHQEFSTASTPFSNTDPKSDLVAGTQFDLKSSA